MTLTFEEALRRALRVRTRASTPEAVQQADEAVMDALRANHVKRVRLVKLIEPEKADG